MRNVLSILLVLLCWAAVSFAVQTSGKIPVTTKSEKAREHFKQGLDLSDKLRGFDSLAHFKKATEEDPNMAIAFLQVAVNSPSPKEFFENLGKAKSLSKAASDGERLWIAAVEAGANARPAQQLETFQKLVATYPEDERAHMLLGGAYFGLQEWEKAIVEYNKAIAINPKFSPPYNQMGYAYRFLEKYSESEKAFKKYIELIPDDPNPYDSYAELLMRTGRYDESIAQYKKALSLDPQFLNASFGIAANYNFKGDYNAARKELEAFLKSARNDGERRATLFAMSVSYASQKDWTNALAQQQKAYEIANATNDISAMSGDLFFMGIILLESKKPDEAKGKFDRSAKLIADSKLSEDIKQNAKRNRLFNLAAVALAKNDLPAAKKHSAEFAKLAQAAKNRFQIWQSHEMAGRIAFAEKNYALAATELSKANVQNPQNLFRIAQAHEASGNAAKAKEMYRKVAEFNGLNSLVYAFVRKEARAKSDL